MQGDLDALGVLGAAPAEPYGKAELLAHGHLRLEEIIVDYLLIGLHHGLLYAAVGIVGILDLETQPASVAELVEGEAREPLLGVIFQQVAEGLYHLGLIEGACNIAVGVELAHYHRLCDAAVDLLEAPVAHLCQGVGVSDLAPAEALVLRILLCNVIGPAPVERHILIHRPDIGLADSLSEFLLHDYLCGVKILYAADAEDSGNVGRVLFKDLVEAAIKIRNALICSALCEGEPVSRGLVVHSQQQSAEGPKILGYRHKVLVGDIRVDRKGEGNVLSVAADITHTGKRLVICSAAEASLVGKVIVVGIVPLERHLCVLHHL